MVELIKSADYDAGKGTLYLCASGGRDSYWNEAKARDEGDHEPWSERPSGSRHH